MILPPDAVKLIRERRKTQTRWPAGVERRCEVTVGRIYSVQPGAGQRGVLRITIMATRSEALGQLTRADALREGFKFERQFYDHWTARYGRLDLEQAVWVVTFAFGDVRDRFDVPRLLRAGAPHAPICRCGRGLPDGATRCPKCGAEQPVAASDLDRGYTQRSDQALSNEPEAIDDRTQQRFSTQARARDAARRPVAREAQATLLGRRVRQEALTSLRAGANIDPELAEINRQLASIERKRIERAPGDFPPSACTCIVRRRPASTPAFTVAKASARSRRAPAFHQRPGRPFAFSRTSR